jgi:hypothetical protein
VTGAAARLLELLRDWHSHPAFARYPFPLNPSEVQAGRRLEADGVAVLVSIDGKPYLQPATEVLTLCPTAKPEL